MTEGIDVREQITKLIQLQEIDAEAFDLEAQKESFPEKIARMDESLESKKNGMKCAEEELKKLQVSRNEKETDMKAKEERIGKHQSELYQIKNNKEYKALQQEIDSIKADVSLLEEEIINLLDSIEKAESRLEEEKKIFEEERRKSEKEKEEIRAKEAEFSRRLEELRKRKAELGAEVDPAVLARYEKILENRGRVAVTPVNGECCGECNMQLRQQLINEVKLGKDLVFCENCGRVLYARE